LLFQQQCLQIFLHLFQPVGEVTLYSANLFRMLSNPVSMFLLQDEFDIWLWGTDSNWGWWK
jgi:hypothetical protein